MIRSDASYDEISKIVNEQYRQSWSFREVMRETGLSFDEVWDCLGYKDYFDYQEVHWKE